MQARLDFVHFLLQTVFLTCLVVLASACSAKRPVTPDVNAELIGEVQVLQERVAHLESEVQRLVAELDRTRPHCGLDGETYANDDHEIAFRWINREAYEPNSRKLYRVTGTVAGVRINAQCTADHRQASFHTGNVQGTITIAEDCQSFQTSIGVVDGEADELVFARLVRK